MDNFIVKNKSLLIAFFIFLGLAAASGVYVNQTAEIKKPNQLSEKAIQEENIAPKENAKTSQSAASSSENKSVGEQHALYVGEKKYEIFVPKNSTVYGLMNALAARGDIIFSGKNSSGLGFFVDEINGIKNNASGNTYWLYYINDMAASVGISNYVLKADDIISWKYEKPQF